MQQFTEMSHELSDKLIVDCHSVDWNFCFLIIRSGIAVNKKNQKMKKESMKGLQR